ncbi:hypothetical protein ACLB2K_075378 [Fragaria x ananassa]
MEVSCMSLTSEANKWNRAKPCRNCEQSHCVDCFLQGHALHRFQYGVKVVRYLASWHGTCTTGRADPPEVAIRRANDSFNKEDGPEFGDSLPEMLATYIISNSVIWALGHQ